MTYLPDKESSKSLKEDGVRYNVSYRQHASSIFLNFGLSARYRLFDTGALFLDINFQQPLQNPMQNWWSMEIKRYTKESCTKHQLQAEI